GPAQPLGLRSQPERPDRGYSSTFPGFPCVRMRGPATTAVTGGGSRGGGGRNSSSSSSSSRRRFLQRPPLAFALVLAVGVVLTLVGVGVSVRWSGRGGAGNSPVPLSSTKSKISSGRSSGSGKGVDGGGSTRTNAGAVGTDRTARSDDGVGDDSAGDSGGIKPPGARWAGSGERAYAVIFPDVQDPLVLERAEGLWNSLEALKNGGDDVVAIVPRYFGQQLIAPLVEIGYRVLPRKSPAPIWRASGRFVQQSMAAIGTGWGSSGGGDGGGRGHGWNLLALEALALTEYQEVVVLDQKASFA
ncbi:unnamed protein product, partial [Pylaiella littoralis]